MFKNYFKIALRNLGKHKGDTAINLIGLSVAFTSALLLFLSVFYEFSFDRFHKNADSIYHLYFTDATTTKPAISSSMPVPLLPALKAAYPEIKNGVRVINTGVIAQYKDKKISTNLKYTDPDFFKMFSFPIIKGSAATALSQLDNIVLRKGSAKAIFGSEEPLGKVLQLRIGDEWKPFIVSAVADDFPDNSTLNYDLVIRFENDINYIRNLPHWDNQNHDVFVQLADGTNVDQFQKKLSQFLKQNLAERLDKAKRDGATPLKDGSYLSLNFLSLLKEHTDETLNHEGNSISSSYLYLLLVIGILIVTIACINFINLSIGRSFTRSREIGLRKTLGAQRWQLTIQFWTEAFIICLFAFSISCFFCSMLIPSFKQLFAMNIRKDVLFTPLAWSVMFMVFIFITLLAGGYPAWLMSKFNIVEILKGKLSIGHSQKLRSSLIVVQFSIAILLIVCTLVSWQQIDYLRSKPLGYNRNQVISIPVEGDIKPGKVLELLRAELNGYPAVESISGIYDNLGRGTDGSSRTSIVGFDYKNKEVKSHWMGVSYDFVKTLNLQLLQGRDFSREFITDTNAVVINEQMAAQLGEKEAVGTLLNIHDSAPPFKVIGVVKDYNFQSLRSDIKPLTLVINPDFDVNYILVKVKPTGLAASMQLLKNTWKKILPNSDFKGSFLDENIERQYRREEKLGQIFISGAVTAIALSCMGLLAMVILMVRQRKKEIGIRKVLGASVTNIVQMVSSDFLKLVIISAIIAFPIGWWAMTKWLESYAYRIHITWWVFAIAALASLAIALITVSFQSIRAATSNPVKSLRTE